MRLVFLGTPEFAAPTLEAVAAAGHRLLEVVTQPDRPSGRGQPLAASPVKQAALRLGLPVYQPERIKHLEAGAHLAELGPDAMVVVGYGQIIPQSVIDIPPLGILNVHASLLPKYRGAAPIQWAIARGEMRTGVTTMRIDAGLDTGDILLQRATEIDAEETALELGARLAAMGAELLVATLAALEKGSLVPVPQDSTQATYAPLLKKEDGRIDWRRPAREIHNLVRAVGPPWPGAFSDGPSGRLMVGRTKLCPAPADAKRLAPGQLVQDHGRVLVGTGDGLLELVELTLPAGAADLREVSF